MIIGQIEQRLPTLRRSEQRVAAFVLGRPTVVVHMSIADLAERALVSEPTIMRFCKAVGCVGFMDFKLGLARDLERRTLAMNQQNPSVKGPSGLGQALFEQIGKDLGEHAARLDLTAIDTFLEVCAGSSRIIVLHSGAEQLFADSLVQSLRECGLEVCDQTDCQSRGRRDGLFYIVLRSATRMEGAASLLTNVRNGGGRTALIGLDSLPYDLALPCSGTGLADHLVYVALIEALRLGIESRLRSGGRFVEAASDLLQSKREEAYALARRQTRHNAKMDGPIFEGPNLDGPILNRLGKETA